MTAGFISITVTWVLSNFSPASFAPLHLPHFCARTAYPPPPSHSNTICWQFAACPLSRCFLYLLCTAGNSKVVLLKHTHGTAAVSSQSRVIGETGWESLQVLAWKKKTTTKKTISVSFICSLRECWIPDASRLDEVEHCLKPPHLARLLNSNDDRRWRQVGREKQGDKCKISKYALISLCQGEGKTLKMGSALALRCFRGSF